MTQAELVERAKQGDPNAIARLLNHELQPRGVTVRVHIQNQGLLVLLQSTRLLNQKTFTQFLYSRMTQINPATVDYMRVYAQLIGEDSPIWQDEIDLSLGLPSEKLTLVSASPPGQLSRVPEQPPPDFFSNLRTFQLAAVFPYHDVFSNQLYKSPIVKLLLFFGLFPLAIDLVADPENLAQIAWLLGIYYASIWGVVLYGIIQPNQFSWRNVLTCVLFTIIIGIPILITLQRIPPFNLLYSMLEHGLPLRIIGFVLGVGLLEELCKGLPIQFLIMRNPQHRHPLTGAFYGAMSGLGFAIAEGVLYSFQYQLGLDTGYIGLSEYIVINTIRFVSLPLFHAILAGIVGYFIGLAAINPSRKGAILFIGVAIAALLHGLYNSFAGEFLGFAIVGFSILLFVIYLQRSQDMANEMQNAEKTK